MTYPLERTNKTLYATKKFYKTDEWKEARDEFLKGKKLKCEGCGKTPHFDPYKNNDINDYNFDADYSCFTNCQELEEYRDDQIRVDHKLPVKHFWHLRLNPVNFQMLCGSCNKSKSNWILYHHLKEMRKLFPKPNTIEILSIDKS